MAKRNRKNEVENNQDEIVKSINITKSIVKIIDILYGFVLVEFKDETKEVKIQMNDFQLGFILNNKNKYISKCIEIIYENDDILPLSKFEVVIL